MLGRSRIKIGKIGYLSMRRCCALPTKSGRLLATLNAPKYFVIRRAVADTKNMRAFAGNSGPATMAHFHRPAALGKNGPPVICLGPKGSPVPAPVKGEATLTPEQAQQFSAGEWYINVHTQDHQAGEIRGQVIPPKS
jgi:hypothetical protein